MKGKTIGLMGLVASLYVAIGIALPGISFGMIQCRVSDALYPLIVMFGLPWVFGLTIGQVIYNLYGYALGFALGTLDLLSPLIFLPFKLLTWKLGLKALPTIIIAIALWVGYLLNTLFGVPFWLAVITVGIGEAIAELGLGLPLLYAVRRTLKK